MTQKPQSPVVFQLPVSEDLRDRLAYFMGDEIASDPRFWLFVLERGIDKVESDVEQARAESREEADMPPADTDDVPF
ncbi:hypothetical protein K9U40_13770 [Xanthobacter autotrophicus]|uniref:hypothetical protein n=1 Tax=Xanthobacter TaxID=279 RepID=UPI0024AC0C82|nr:hypothetical protein [Xanthobacter autotrophicus]MDI4665388.1 hypothetical protein [Xanthobacter autotrophicus]